METKELIDKLEEYIEIGHKFKTYELLKAAVRKIAYLEAECERLNNITKAIEELSKKSEWISVEDRLPEREGTYLVCTFKGARKFGVYGRYCVCDEPQFEYDAPIGCRFPKLRKAVARNDRKEIHR